MNRGMPEFQNRTLICSVLFIDIVEYSRKPVVEQGNLKDRFNSLLSEALRGVAINDRIILDTGDGAAISFIGDPEDALFVATGLRDVISGLANDSEPELSTRMGINLGPVRLVKDINGQPNIIGDGINVAQRVMTFARPGQVLVSRSYYEVVSRLSDESSKLFSYEGARTDKHIREHEVYAVGAIPGVRRRFEGSDPGTWSTGGTGGGAGLARASQTVRSVADRVARRPRIATLVTVVAILGVALGARAYRTGDQPIKAPPAEVAAVAPQAGVATAPQTPAATLPPIRGLPPEPVERRVEQPPPAAAPEESAAKKASAKEEAKARDKAAAKDAQGVPREPARPAAVAEAAPASAPAMVNFAVSPWGEVYVDGKMQGVSPPLQDLEVSPGRHRIEIRNSASQPHVVTVNAKSGERIRIKHKFN